MVRRLYENVDPYTESVIRKACDIINDYMIGDYITPDDISNSRNKQIVMAYNTLFNYFTKYDRKLGYKLLDADLLCRDLGTEQYEDIDNYKYAIHTLLTDLCGYDEDEAYRILDL